MCGIVGIIGTQSVTNRLVKGLKLLEYRGYDSAGIAVISNHTIERVRAEGKIVRLEAKLEETPHDGLIGIGHTRWATHGAPTVPNAHPHATDRVAVVHNGIIENFTDLRKELEGKGIVFETETDTEVVPRLIDFYLDRGMTEEKAVKTTVSRLEGAFALGIIFADNDNLMIAARRGSPLAIGYGETEMYLGSDALALAPLTNKISYLEDGDIAIISRESVHIFDEKDEEVTRPKVIVSQTDMQVAKGHYRHYMLKEIYEQPSVIGTTLNRFYHPVTGEVDLPEMGFDLASVPRITIIACGTSFYAGMVAKYWIEQIARVPVDIDIASEYRYRQPILTPGGMGIFISQSGETADTLAALRHMKEQGQHTLSVVNVEGSSMARESENVLYTSAGPEIGVASTKAFTTQLVTLACFTLALARKRRTISHEEEKTLSHSLAEVSSRALEVLHHDERIKELAHEVAQARDVLFIGRGLSYPISLEGALKLKEISYIHAEAAAAGELKHGPIALVDENVPIVALAPSDELFDKTASNIQEVAARGGKVIMLGNHAGIEELQALLYASIELPDASPFASPILYAIPVQLLAYHVAVAKGTDVDQPRNLAKSVTVE